MKRIVTHLLVAAGLAVGVVGVAQAHTDLNIGLSLGAPSYGYGAPVYVQPAPVYRSTRAVWPHRYDERWGGERGNWQHSDWNHGGDHRDGRSDHRG
jgi:hypothetical protein